MMTDQQDDLLPYQAPERIGLVMDDFGSPLWALAHKDEADRAVHYTRSDLAEARVALAIKQAAGVVDCTCSGRDTVLNEKSKNSVARWQACGEANCDAITAQQILALPHDPEALEKHVRGKVNEALEAAVAMVESSVYWNSGGGRGLDPVSKGREGLDQHHATIAAAIRAMKGEG